MYTTELSFVSKSDLLGVSAIHKFGIKALAHRPLSARVTYSIPGKIKLGSEGLQSDCGAQLFSACRDFLAFLLGEEFSLSDAAVDRRLLSPDAGSYPLSCCRKEAKA